MALNPYSAGIGLKCLSILMSKVDLCTVKVKIFIIGIQMKQNELTYQIMMISNWKNNNFDLHGLDKNISAL